VPDHKLIAAYLVTRSGQALSSAELRSFLRDRLPAYMIPAAFVFLEKLPRTPNGKIDRRSLPAPDHAAVESHSQREEQPFNEVEKTLADIWRQVSGLESVGRHDNFFDLGGHSILITQIIARCRNTLGIELTLRNFFESPTIGELAPIVEQQLLEQLEQIPETEAQRLASSIEPVSQGTS